MKWLMSTAFLTGLGGCADSSFTIDNRSSFEIDEINVAPVDSVSWGSNLLGSRVLLPGEALHVVLDCDVYDVRITDQTATECILTDLDLCFDSGRWVIDDAELTGCRF